MPDLADPSDTRADALRWLFMDGRFNVGLEPTSAVTSVLLACPVCGWEDHHAVLDDGQHECGWCESRWETPSV